MRSPSRSLFLRRGGLHVPTYSLSIRDRDFPRWKGVFKMKKESLEKISTLESTRHLGANWAWHLHASVLTLLRWQVTFRINYPPRESRVPWNIYRHPVVYTDTPGIMGLPGPSTPFPPLCSPAARADPTLCSLCHYFPSQFITIDLCHPLCRIIWYPRASKSRYITATHLCSSFRSFIFVLPSRPTCCFFY